ncbi:class I SAM-dependent methyltransferase [Litoribacter alkaliphilus]|uniref:Class I SAM-dependent methyltransferase n=1 Tax=Litoribacter ruber TaxID=702568 RepID=A0AAP2CH22_9BACT|nr:class I SAM-dependent methyltransferase [Litoribacter alkaliphilus]MBS9523454.1 class I SAM-dependent methyltransferase [Litoribacter alkaliphilus]
MSTATCQVCQNQTGNQEFTVKEHMFGTLEAFPYLRCSQCGTIQQIDPPQDLSPYYSDKYYSFVCLNQSNSLKRVLKKIRLSAYQLFPIKALEPVYGAWFRKLNLNYDDKIADIGCGSGQLIYELYCGGYRDLTGFDPFMKSPAQINESVKLERKSVFEIDEKYDCVMMHHAFEHMDRPLEVLRQAHRILKPKGQLIIRIPVADAEVWKRYGAEWVQLDAPRHLFIHSEQGMKMLGESAGLTLGSVIYDSTSFQFWASELCKRNIAHYQADPLEHFDKETLKAWEKEAMKLNKAKKGDQAAFYFRKL